MLAHFNKYKFVRIKNAYGENNANKTLPGVQEAWRHEVGYAQYQANVFL